MSFTPVNDGDLAVAPQLQQILDALQGVAGAGQPIDLVALDSAVSYALTVRNLGTGGLGLDVRGSDDVSRLQVTDDGVLFGGTIGFQSGTASAPGIFFTGDTNTGLYHPAADIVGLTTGGTERVRISASGLTVTSGALIGTVHDTGGMVFNVMAYGAIGDGAQHLLSNTYGTLAAAQAVYPGATSLTNTTDQAAIMTAVNAAIAAGGGVVFFPPGKYLLSETLLVTYGIKLQGHLGDDDDAGTGSGAETTVIQWAGVDQGTMIKYVSTTAYNVLTGGGIDGIVLDGYWSAALTGGTSLPWITQIAGIALHLKGTNHFRLGNLRVRNVQQIGVWLDDNAIDVPANIGHSTDNLIEQLDFICGFWLYDPAHPAVPGFLVGADAVGLLFDGSSLASLGSATKNRVLEVRGTFYDGDLVRFKYADNNRIDHIHAMGPIDTTGFPTAAAAKYNRLGQGKALRLQTAVQLVDYATYPWAFGFPAGNTFGKVNGSVFAENYTAGNRIDDHQSENGIIQIQDVTKTSLHYTSMDYISEAVHRTHSYRMTDELSIGAGALLPGASVTFAEVGTPPWGGWALPTAATTRVHGWVRPYDWWGGQAPLAGGLITAIRVELMMSTSVAAKQVVLRARAETATAGASANALAAPVATTEYDVALSGATAVNTPNTLGVRAYADIPINAVFRRGDSVSFFVQRESAGATEHTGSLIVLGVSLIFQSDGPNSGPAGAFTANPSPYWQASPSAPF